MQPSYVFPILYLFRRKEWILFTNLKSFSITSFIVGSLSLYFNSLFSSLRTFTRLTFSLFTFFYWLSFSLELSTLFDLYKKLWRVVWQNLRRRVPRVGHCLSLVVCTDKRVVSILYSFQHSFLMWVLSGTLYFSLLLLSRVINDPMWKEGDQF